MRTIDYALARNVDVHVAAEGFEGSDHRLVVFDCLWGRKRLRVGLWNAQRDRRVDLVVASCLKLINAHRLDVLLLGEANDYVEVLELEESVQLVGLDDRPGARETAILVRRGVRVSSSWCAQLTRAGWITVRGGRTAPKYMPTALVGGWLRVAVVHAPPSVRYRGGRRPVGPVRRVASMVALMARVLRFARRRPRGQSVLIAGDWNATPAARGPYSPRWLARLGRLRIVAPRVGTHR